MNFYNYGTAGFRYNHSIIEKIAENIGRAVANLSCIKSKSYGIMITASHNLYEDNGVKIVNDNGNMISLEEENYIINYVNYENIKHTIFFNNANIVIGYDTRASSPFIADLIINGIRTIDKNAHIYNLHYVTTPQLHFYTAVINKNIDYIDYYYLNVNEIKRNIIVDCANGIGSITLNNIIKKYNLDNITLINTDVTEYKKLNNNCGSDYVYNTLNIPSKYEETDKLYASLDGDADRVIFYYKKNDVVALLNGDKISALLCYYIKTLKVDTTIGVIHTCYSNGEFIRYIKNIDNVNIECAATGVKNLHTKAEKYDIGIYFEPNGHGTILFNRNNYENEKINKLKKIFNQYIGDGITNLFGVLYILDELGMTTDEWNNLYKDVPYKMTKINVNDKNKFITTGDERTLIEPLELQQYMNYIMGVNNNVFCFIRPSGTENILRLYVEGENEELNEDIINNIVKYIDNNY